MEHSERELLSVGVERGYIDPQVAAAVLRQAKRTGRSVEDLLLRGKVLSRRRLHRLRLHVRYRTVRKVDKVYALLAVRKGWLTKGQAKAALERQRQGFEAQRECSRLGSELIELGLLTVEQDQQLRAEATGSKLPSEVVRRAEETPSSAATLALHEGSMGHAVPAATYRAIEEAVRRVDALRAMEKDLSTSDNLARGDSANEIENALTTLARRRAGATAGPARSGSARSGSTPPEPPRAPRRRRKVTKKSTGLLRILRLGAA